MKSIDEQVAILMHGSEFGDRQIKEMMTQELRQRLTESSQSGLPLRVYCGYDVTAPDIHLGHTITMRKLRQFQEFGHDVTFLIGSFTTLIGDPSDRDEERSIPLLEQIEQNARTYAEQAFKILDSKKTSVRYNHEWLSQLTFKDIINMASYFTVQQFLVRDRLRNRYERNEPLWLRELLYPLAQGYDAVSLRTDVQIGATEQLFNLLAGRKLQEVFGQKPQVCITFPVLIGTDGEMRMSKSLGNYIGINEPPDTQYGKVMSLPDKLMLHYFNLVTRWLPEQIAAIEADLNGARIHPMEAKKKLAWEIVDAYHGTESADAATAHFERVHQAREFPADMPAFNVPEPVNIIDLLVATELCKSKSEARRVVQQGGVKINGQPVDRTDELIEPCDAVLQKGKRHFVRLTCQK